MTRHISVLLNEAIQILQPQQNDNFIDCTLGDAGHSEAILEKIGPNGKLLGIDIDVEAVLRVKRFLYRFEDRAIIVRDNFVNLKKIVEKNKFFPINGILMDLGWSSPQFEERGRGFSFQKDEPLDMRYGIICHSERSEESFRIQADALKDPSHSFGMTIMTAADIVNDYGQEELTKNFKTLGEENLSAEIAEAIVLKRKDNRIDTTKQLVEIILEVYRKKLHSPQEVPWIGGIHPATKVFQALRIAVNNELEALRQALPQAVEVLAPGGRLAVITFHSLEDRIVKHYFQSVQGKIVNLVNKKPIIPSAEELTANPRARSAKLRVVEKI